MSLHRRRPTQTAEVARELEALEAVLAGEDPGAERAWLASLTSDVRDSAPRMRAEFAAVLDARVESGFAGRRRVRSGSDDRVAGAVSVPSWSVSTGASRRWRSRRWVLGVAASALIAVSIGGGAALLVSGNNSAGLRVQGPALPATAARPEAVTPGTAAGSSAPAASPPARSAAQSSPSGSQARQVQRNASLGLTTAASRLNSVNQGIVRITGEFNGIVQSSQVSSEENGSGSAYFVLSIPSGRVSDALTQLSQLARVQSLSQSSQDITDPYDAARAQVSQDEAERRALLRQLADAVTLGQIDAIRIELRALGGRLAADRNALASLTHRARQATVEVQVTSTGKAIGSGTSLTPGGGLHDALLVLGAGLGAALIALAVVVPLVVATIPAWLAIAVWRRRRREGALEPA